MVKKMTTVIQAIDTVIKEEIKLRKLYHKAKSCTKSDSVIKILNMLEEDGKEHEDKLKELKTTTKPDWNTQLTSNMATQSTLRIISEPTTLKKTLELAMQKEDMIASIYTRLSDTLEEDIKDSFRQLKENKNTHFVLIEKELRVLEYI